MLFTLFLLTYMIVLSVTDKLILAAADDGSTILMHYLPGLTRILGFVSFWISRRLVKTPGCRRGILIAASVIFLASAVIPITAADPGPVLVSALTLSLSLGHLGGLIYYCVSVAFSADRRKGRFIGVACAGSILLQYFLSEIFGVSFQLMTAALMFVFISYMILKAPADFILEDPLPYIEESPEFTHDVRLQLIGILGIILVCTMLACRTDIAFVSMSLDGSVNIYSYPRLAMIAGYLVMGFTADLCSHKIWNAVFFSCILLSAVLVLMPFQTGGYAFFLTVYYFFISMYVFFYTYSFISVAPRTGSPELWASIGRPLSDLCVAPISLLMLKIGDERLNASPVSYALYYSFFLVIMYLLMTFIKINPNLTKDADASAGGGSRSVDEWLDRFPLTPREREVALMLIDSDEPIKAIASTLGISERSVYRYAASIYEKTGTDNRTGLIKSQSGYFGADSMG